MLTRAPNRVECTAGLAPTPFECLVATCFFGQGICCVLAELHDDDSQPKFNWGWGIGHGIMESFNMVVVGTPCTFCLLWFSG